MRVLATLLMGSAIISGCGPGVGDYTDHLINGFYLYRTDSTTRFIAQRTWTPEVSPMIPSYVEEYEHDRRFITAKQKVVSPISVTYKYWIIDTKIGEDFGPYDDHKKFSQKFEDLNLGIDLYIE